MKKWVLAALVAAMVFLHQDSWNWRSIDPVFLGILPVGLAYHAFYTVGTAVLMWLLVTLAWPSELERDAEQHSGDDLR
jgi:hypothetical protein